MKSKLAICGGEPVVKEKATFSWPPVSELEVAQVNRLLRAGELSYYGREGEVERLEDAFRDYLGVRYALAVSSGTAALHSAFFGVGLGPGDEVIAPTYTFLATVMPVFVVNALPVLAEAEPDTGNIDPWQIEARITSRTKAIVVTHMWGHPCNMKAITRIARKHNLRLIEDCSHAHGAVCNGRQVGTFGDVAAFSLQAKKLVPAGQGGLLVTNDQEVYERAVLLGHFKVRCFQEVKSEKYRPFCGTGFGLNYRMHPLAAAIANVQFRELDRRIQGRQENLELLSEQLAGVPGIQVPVKKTYVDRHSYYSFKPLYKPWELQQLPVTLYVEALRAEGVEVEKSETLPLHLEPIFQTESHGMLSYDNPGSLVDGGKRQLYSEGSFPASELYASRALVLPPFTEPEPVLLAEYGMAFRKVAEGVDQLRRWEGRLRAQSCSRCAEPVKEKPISAVLSAR